MNLFGLSAAWTVFAASAFAQGYVYEQPMAPAGGVLRQSQLWVDPSGQNDLDSDAILWEDFELPQTTTITRLRWWGQAAPPPGFRIGFFTQDPGTIAVHRTSSRPAAGRSARSPTRTSPRSRRVEAWCDSKARSWRP